MDTLATDEGELSDLACVLLLTRRAGFAQDPMASPLNRVGMWDFYCGLSGVMIRMTMVVVTIVLLRIPKTDKSKQYAMVDAELVR